MKKVRANALWNELSDEQRETLDKWLFGERLGYAVAWQRAQKELGFKGSKTSLHRYFARREKERVLTEFTELRDGVAAIRSAPEDATSLRAAAMKVLGQFLLQQVRRAPDKVKEWAPVADLMVRNEYNEIVREAKAREHQMRRDAMAFAKEKFQFDMIEHAVKALPQLRELEEARKDPDLKEYEENAMVNRLRREMFGVVWEAFPESAKEEEEMLAARRERQAQKQREEEARGKRERITEPETPTPSSPCYAAYMEWKAKEAKREGGG